MKYYKCGLPRPEDKDHHPQSAGNALSNSTQYTDGLNFWKGTFAGSCSTCYLQNPQVIYHKAAFQTVGPQPLLVHGVILPQV